MSALAVLSGVFFPKNGILSVSTESGDVDLPGFFASYEGRTCDLRVHHLPTNPILPGGGSCLLGSSCPFHSRNPDRVFEFGGEGVIGLREGTVTVGDSVVPFDLIDGHYGRLIVFSPPEAHSVGSPLGDLLSSSEELKSLLSNLKSIL